MHKYLILLAIVLGIVGLFVSLIATSGNGPDGFTDLNVTIASISGIFLGGGLGAWLDGFPDPPRLSVLLSVLALGLLYLVMATVPQFQYQEIKRWLDVYFAAGGALSGAALSVMLAHLRR